MLQRLVEMAARVPIMAMIINAHAQMDILGNSVTQEVSKNVLKVLEGILLRIPLYDPDAETFRLIL